MKNIAAQDIDLNKLNSLGIYELRNLARSLGVQRPTTLRRDELINGIKSQVNSGGIATNIKARGRKPRDFSFDVTKVLDYDEPFYSSSFLDDAPPSQVRSGEVCTESRVVSGFVHPLPSGNNTLIGIDLNNYYIPVKIITTFCLTLGDFIEAKAVFSKDRQTFVIEEIYQINNDTFSPSYNKKVALHFDNMEGIRPNVPYEINSTKFLKGSRVLISTSKSFDRIQEITNSVKTINEAHKVALLIDETDDAAQYLRTQGVNDVYLAKVNFSIKKQILTCLLCLFQAKQMAEQGKDIVLFLDSITKLFKIYNNSAFPDGRVTPGQVNLSPLVDLKTFFLSARALKKGGSLTIAAFINSPVSDVEDYIFNEFADLSNAIINK